jgi:hypothetical protein
MISIASWMENSWANEFIARNTDLILPTMETFHFFGMCLLFGSLLVMDLRLIGWEKASSIAHTDKVAIIALVGFGMNIVTGVIFCFYDPFRYFFSISFQIKMILIVLAVLNLLFYKLKLGSLVAEIGPGEDTPTIAKVSGAASLILWLGVISFGRLIPYLE